MEQIINKFKPVFYLNSREKYFPVNIDYLYRLPVFKGSDEVYTSSNAVILKEISQGDLKPKRACVEYKPQGAKPSEADVIPNKTDKTIQIPVPEDELKGFEDLSGEIYAITKLTENTLDIYYFTLYPFNEGKAILDLQRTGDHQGDLEVVIVELDKMSMQPLRVFYGSHATEDGKWKNFDKIELFNGTHPVVYIARGGHGHYDQPGVAFRYFGFANDFLDKGYFWDPKVNYLKYKDNPAYNDITDGWMYYTGLFGKDGITNIFDKGWFEKKPDAKECKPPIILKDREWNTLKASMYLLLAFLAWLVVTKGMKVRYPIIYFGIILILFAVLIKMFRWAIRKYA
jgi:hypothetical protein